MAGSVNKVILVGNLGADPEARTMQNGDEVVNMRIATSETWNDKGSGERKERTEWHQVVIWNQNIAKIAKQYLRKGAKVYLEGQLQTRKWQDQSGQDRYTTEVVIPRFRGELTMLSGRGEGGGMGDGGGDDYGAAHARAGGGAGGGGGGGGRGRAPSRNDDPDDDIPF